MGVFLRFMGSPDCKDLKNGMGKLIFEVPDSHLFQVFWGAWMTFKKPELDKTLKNGLIMIETNPLNHKWLDFGIQSGLALHQFKKKLLLRNNFRVTKKFLIAKFDCIFFRESDVITALSKKRHEFNGHIEYRCLKLEFNYKIR